METKLNCFLNIKNSKRVPAPAPPRPALPCPLRHSASLLLILAVPHWGLVRRKLGGRGALEMLIRIREFMPQVSQNPGLRPPQTYFQEKATKETVTWSHKRFLPQKISHFQQTYTINEKKHRQSSELGQANTGSGGELTGVNGGNKALYRSDIETLRGSLSNVRSSGRKNDRG